MANNSSSTVWETYTGPNAGTTTDAPTDPSTIINPTGNNTQLDPQAMAQAVAQYGYSAYWLQDPEIGPILQAAAREGWSPDTLKSALAKTDFVKNHSESQRNYQLRLHDPLQQAGLAQDITQKASDIVTAARRMGIRINSDRANQIAVDAIQFGWDSNQETSAVYAEGQRALQQNATMGTPLVDPTTGRTAYSGPNGEPGYGGPQPGMQSWTDPSGKMVWFQPGAQPSQGNVEALKNYKPGTATDGVQMASGGETQGYAMQLKTLAHDYLINLDDSTAQRYGMQIAAGQATVQGIQSTFADQAKGRFATSPDIQKAIANGSTPAQFLSPYQQAIAKTLEISPDAVDFTNPKYAGVLSYSDPKTGSPRLMNLSEATNWARQQPEWDVTQNARDSYSTMAKNLSTELGMAKY